MKRTLFFIILILPSWSSFSRIVRSEKPVIIDTGEGTDGYSAGSRTIKNENSGLWLLTAKVTENYTMQRDTVMSFKAGNHKMETEKHAASRTVSHGQITAVIENQAENPGKDFLFISDSGEPISITVSGRGTHTGSSKYLETIDGKMISADNSDINVSGSALPQASIQFGYSDDGKFADISIHIKAKGTDKGRRFYDEWKDYGGDIDDYGISCSGGCDLSSDKNCTITKTGSGYQASWKSSEKKQRHTVDGTEFITEESSLEVTISPYKEPDKPEITLYGCSELGTEEPSEVIAPGRPEGGKFRFWVEPDNLLTVQSDGESSANLSGATPWKGTLYVEYTSPEGKTNQTSQPASFVKIENYNNGQEIPQIALFDIDGKKLSGIINVPISINPEGVTDLVKFVPADPAVLSVVGLGNEVQLQGVRIGTTNLQAKTNCGNPTGPSVDVEVVNCDKETVETLERMREAATKNL